jgi:hypothetical protein
MTSSGYPGFGAQNTPGFGMSPSTNWFGNQNPSPAVDPYSQVKCPNEEDMDPCTCDDNGDLECYGSRITDAVFQDVFARLLLSNTKHLHALKLYKTELTRLDASIFGEFTFACIDINGNQHLSPNWVHRTTLYKSKDIMTSFKFTGLSDAYLVEKAENDGAIFENVDGFHQLNSFWVTATRIPKIQRSAFGRCELPSLKTVYLPKNNIEEVGDYAFYRLPNLTYLNLRDNEISRISNFTFSFEKPSDEILVLDLQGNIITSDAISPSSFLQLNRPVNLNLYYNLITYLDEETFKPILQNPKSSIIISNNPIICDCRMKWLLEEAPDYMDRVHGLMCGGKNELWYFTPDQLEIECNETVLTERYNRAFNSAVVLTLNARLLMPSLLFSFVILNLVYCATSIEQVSRSSK